MKNRLEQLDGRLGTTVGELADINRGRAPVKCVEVGTGNEIDHEAWVEAEYEAVAEERERLSEIVLMDGTVDYRRGGR